MDFPTKRLERVTMVCSIVFLIYFRARYAFIIYSGADDLSYILWLKKLIGLPSAISFSNTDYLPGIALLWLPAGVLSRILSLWSPVDVVLPALVGVSSFILWGLSYLIVDQIIGRFDSADPGRAPGSGIALCWMLSMPLLFYATNRTTLAHPGEVFVAFLMLESLLSHRPIRAALLAVLLTSVRINDAAAFILLGGYFLDAYSPRRRSRRLAVTLILLALVVGIPVVYVGFVRGYNSMNIPKLFAQMSLRRAAHVLFGLDWGLLFTGPVWLIVFAAGFLYWRALSWTSRAAWFWMLSELAVCVGWRDNGTEFAYRYMLGAYAAALPVYLDLWKKGKLEGIKKTLRWAFYSGAAWMCYLTWIYKTNSEVTIGETPEGYGNPVMQIQALRQWLHPIRVIRPFFLSPPATVLYSWFLPHSHITAKYALSGFRLVLLTFLTVLSAGILAVALIRRNRSFVRATATEPSQPLSRRP